MNQSFYQYKITRRRDEDFQTGEPVLEIAVKVRNGLIRAWHPVKIYRVYTPDEEPDRVAYAEVCAQELLDKLQADETI